MPKRINLNRPLPVGEVLQKILKPAELKMLERRALIRRAWEQAVGEHLRPRTRLLDYKKKVLWVEVPSSPWMQELQFLKPQILEELQNLLGPGVVTDLRFRIGAK
jgi:predicted nucleic acid-binding Zn ribbon protein